LPPELRIAGLEEAVRTVTAASPDSSSYQRAALSFSIAQLARAYAKPAAPKRHYKALGLSLYNTLQKRAEEFVLQRMSEQFELIFDPRSLAEDHAFVNAIVTLYAGAALYRLRHFAVSWSYAHRVSDICVSIETQKPLLDLQNMLDPRNWSQTVPLVWRQSVPITDYPPDVRGPGPVAPPADPCISKFFEVADFGISPLEIARYSNVLNIDIDVDPARAAVPGRLGFSYQQNLCIFSTLLKQPLHGGIDVDRGFGRCEALDVGTRITARKRARFDQPDSIANFIYNDIAAIYLKLLIEAFVISAALL
jgi:hypothetical protein